MKIGLVSLGCPKNLVDSEVMLGIARQAGHALTADPAEADVLIVNTCAFVDAAKRESIDAILEMALHKAAREGRRLIVTGCLAERYREDLAAEIPEIDAVLGTGEIALIAGAIDPTAAGEAPRLLPIARRPPAPPTFLYDADTPRVVTTPPHYAYVKVAEGCDYACSFCIIPTLRGAYRSRPTESIVREARALVDRGVRELLLVSQDTTYYGIDRGERGALARLLHQLNAIDGLAWIRLLYLHPTTVTDETVAAIGECDKVCKYVDLPLQHASDRVLRRMRRPGTRRSYERLLAKIRHRLPGVTLRSTFIVGFPGETEADVAELAGFIRDTGFDHVGVFTYSHEEGTPAHALNDDVPAGIKERRRVRLMRLQRRIVARANRGRIGLRARLIVDGPSEEHPLVLRGRLEGQAPEIDPVVYLTEADRATSPPGTLLDVQIVAARGYDLVARPLA